MSASQRDRIKGMFLGTAIGDQLFMPNETFTPEKSAQMFGRITDYIQPPYEHKWFKSVTHPRWTDDTQLTLAVAESLITCKGLNMSNQAALHVRCLKEEGNLGFGKSTLNSIERLKQGVAWLNSGEPNGSGNGIVMKCAPLGAYLAHLQSQAEETGQELEKIFETVAYFAMMTHDSALAVDSGHAHVHLIAYCLSQPISFFGVDPSVNIFRYLMNNLPATKWHDDHKLLECLLMLRHLPLDKMDTHDFRKIFGNGTCYVYNSLPFCYAFFLRNPHSIETLYDVGNAGGDTDTNASIVGGLLGALNGSAIFPRHLIDGLWQKDRILNTADRFCDAFGIKE